MSQQERHKVSKCRCFRCRAYRANQTLESRRERAAGRPKLVDATPVREHIKHLGHLGMSPGVIAEAAGINPTSVTRLIFPNKGRVRTRLHRDTAAAILAVTFDLDLVPDLATVLAVGSQRRVQALVVRGWSVSRIWRLLGLEGNQPQMFTWDRVTAKKARAIRELYNQLWDQEPPVTTKYERAAKAKTIRWGLSNGWLPPQAWDDDTIDDPEATGEVGEAKSRGPLKAPLDEVMFFASFGKSTEAIASHFGVSEELIKAKLKGAA